MDAYEIKRARDKYLKKRKTLGLISRGFFKLEEMDKKFNIISLNSKVLDLGAAPGGWCQYLLTKTKNITAVDLLPIKLPIINFLKINVFSFQSEEFFDVILSDMCPNISGISEYDNLRIEEIANKFFDIFLKNLNINGNIIIKLFEHPKMELYRNKISKYFSIVKKFKPKSSHADSKEFYLIGLGYENIRN